MSWSRGRRLRGVAVIAAAVVVLLAGCGGSSDSGQPPGTAAGGGPVVAPCPLAALEAATKPVEVVVWHFLQAKTGEALTQIVDRYNASQSKVHVRLESQGTSNDEVWKKYQSSIKAKDLPAVAILDDTVTQQMIDSDTVLPAQSCIEADHYDMSDFLPTAKAYYTVQGVLYPASLNLSGALLYYNQNHFRRAGLAPDDAPKTLDDVRRDAEKIKAAGVVDKPVVLQLSPALIEMFLTGDHQAMVDNDNGRGPGKTGAAAFDSATTVGFFRWVRSMVDDGLLDALPQTSGQIGHYLAMANQKASMTIETSTAATSVEAFLKGDLKADALPGGPPTSVDTSTLAIGAAPVPGISAPGKLAMGGGAWYITKTTPPEVQAAAWDFTKYFNSVESQVTWNLVGSYLPYRMSAAKDAVLLDRWTSTLSGRWLAMAYDELLNGVDPAFPGPLIGPYDQVREAMRAGVDDLIYKGATPEAAVTRAADGTTKALQQYDNGGF